MSKKTLYIIRHGQTEQNRQKMVQGSGVNSNLNDYGRQQAQAFYEYYHDVPFDKIYTSELKRTHQTVMPFINQGIYWEKHSGFNEMSWGHREGRPITPKDDEEYYATLEAWKSGEIDRRFDGGESPLEMTERQRVALNHVMSYPEEKNVLICMHGRAMRSFMCLLAGISVSNMYQFSHGNTALYQVEFDTESLHFQFIKKNDTTHLNQLNNPNPEFNLYQKVTA